MTAQPPDGLPRYRLLTGTSEEDLSRKVDEALQAGYELHAGPTASSNAGTLVVAQAVLWPSTPAPR